MVLGHESAGTIVSVGPSVTILKPGDRVALEPGIPCRLCDFCKKGTYNLCTGMRFAATPPINGSLCKFYVLPSDFCVPLPVHVSTEEGALIEPLSVGVHVCKLAQVSAGESIVIFGAGPVGLLTAAVARAYGASKVILVDISDKRLDFAKTFYATGVFNGTYSKDPRANAAKIAQDFDLHSGADKAVDASGAPPCINAAIHVLRPGGIFVQAGMGPVDIPFPIVDVVAKELVVKGSFRYATGDYKLSVELVASGKIDVKRLITARFEFEDAAEAFETTKQGQGIKVLIKGPKD